MNAELKKLQRQSREVQERIWEIENAEAEKETAEYVGRFFKARNSYSCPEKPSDYWWLYFKVTGFEGRFVTGFEFQRDKGGRSWSDPNVHRVIYSDHIEISQSDWNRQWRSFLAKLAQDEAK
jgi:hypothetical protein